MSHFLWELTKSNNAFLVKRNGFEFSSDPYNLTGRNTFSSSGFLQENSVAICGSKPAVEKKPNLTHVRLAFKKRKRFPQKGRQPTKGKTATAADFQYHVDRNVLNVKGGVHKAAKVIRKRYANRKGLTQLALRKLYLVHKLNVVRKAKAAAAEKKN